MLKAPLFAGCASEARWIEPGTHVVWNANYWLILLGLFTGVRLEELGQYLVTDIRHEAGIWFIDINTYLDGTEESEFEQKSTKTESSIRQVPSHPILSRMGFLRYVEQLRKRGERFLFPDLKPNKYGHRTQAWLKWFARFLDSVGISEPGKTFHSFRHTFKTAARRARIAEDIHDRLTGHAIPSVGRDYGEAGDLPFLAEEVASISFGAAVDRQLEILFPTQRPDA